MKFVSDFMGWLAHDGAPWRTYPPPNLAGAQARRRAPAPAQARRPTLLRLSAPTPAGLELANAMNGLDHCDPKVHPNHWLIAASRVSGAPVFDKSGRRSGQVRDLSIDKKSGSIIYALVAFGGFLGVGERFHPLPWALLKYDLEKDGYVVPFEIGAIQTAPSLTAEELQWFGAGDSAWRERLTRYYSPFLSMPYI